MHSTALALLNLSERTGQRTAPKGVFFYNSFSLSLSVYIYIYIYIYILDLHRRLTAPVKPHKSSSKQCSRLTRDFDCIFGAFAFLVFVWSPAAKPISAFRMLSGFLVTGSLADLCVLWFWCFLVTGSPGHICFFYVSDVFV